MKMRHRKKRRFTRARKWTLRIVYLPGGHTNLMDWLRDPTC